MCTPERAAAALSTVESRIELLVQENAALFKLTALGVALTADGREWVDAQLSSERAGLDVGALAGFYDRFTEFNDRFKQLVSEWQMLEEDARTDEAWASVVDSVGQLHAGLGPLIEEIAGHVDRLGAYGDRLDEALEEMRAGDSSMLASPLKESYHTVWFEYHEELISLCGRDRATEEAG